MKNKPLFTGIAASISSTEGLKVEDLIGRSGLNTGNFLFVRGLRNLLGVAEDVYRDESHYRDSINKYDYIAISAANWVNPGVDLSGLADFIESTDLPCLVVGLGAQASFGGQDPKLLEGTKKFLKVASERSKSISVRGEYTQEVLNRLGITNTRVTGCPSLLGLSGRTPPKVDMSKLDGLNPSNIILQSTRHNFSETVFSDDPAYIFNMSIYRYAFYNKHPLLLQSEVPDIYITMRRNNNNDIYNRNIRFLERVYQSEADKIREYLENYGLIYWDIDEWLRSISKFKMLIGTRIHGVISGLLAGLPSLLLIHDERTKEMADFFALPHIDSQSHQIFDYDLISRAAFSADLERFYSIWPTYVNGFYDFFTENDIRFVL